MLQLFVFVVLALVLGQAQAVPDELRLMTQGIPDSWVVEKVECKNLQCLGIRDPNIDRAFKHAQSFSKPKTRIQSEWKECKGQMALWLGQQPVKEGLREINTQSGYQHFRSQAEWGIAGDTLNTGFVVCLLNNTKHYNTERYPEGPWERVFYVVHYDGERLIVFTDDFYVITYRATGKRPASQINNAPKPESFKLITEGFAKTWLVDKVQCKAGACNSITPVWIEDAKTRPFGFGLSDVKRYKRGVVEMPYCVSPWVLRVKQTPTTDWLEALNNLVGSQYQGAAEDWGLEPGMVTRGFMACMLDNPDLPRDGYEEHKTYDLVLVVSMNSNRMTLLHNGGYLVTYRAADKTP